MRSGIVIDLTSADRERLERICKDRNVPQKHVWRTEIVLLSADGVGTSEIMRRAGTSKTCVWRWQERFMQEGAEGLLRDKTRPSRIPALTLEIVALVVARTQEAPPGETTHWTASLMAREAGISASSVHRIWRVHGLQPHRVRRFKLSNDPEFIDKLRDVVGLYVAPPAHAIVLSFDEKSQIQALDRSQPGLPLKKGRAGTMNHDYKCNGTTTLFAALNVLDGTVIGRNMQRHRHQEFIRFLNLIEAQVPAGKAIHVILDNSAAHKRRGGDSGDRAGAESLTAAAGRGASFVPLPTEPAPNPASLRDRCQEPKRTSARPPGGCAKAKDDRGNRFGQQNGADNLGHADEE
jgi:transposase